jgi:hypothetical protein
MEMQGISRKVLKNLISQKSGKRVETLCGNSKAVLAECRLRYLCKGKMEGQKGHGKSRTRRKAWREDSTESKQAPDIIAR